MSLLSDSLPIHRKRTATDRAENNGDPLVAKKKARKAAQSNPAQPQAGPKKSANVSLY